MSAVNRPSVLTRLLVHGLLYAAAATMVLPFAWMVSTSLKTRAESIATPPANLAAAVKWILPRGWPSHWHWSNYADAWQAARLGQFYANSVLVAVAVTVLAVIHNALAGFGFAKLRWPGKRPVFAVVLATMMLPYQVYFIFAYVLCKWLGYVDHFQALIVPSLASAFGIFYMRQAVGSVPDDLLDAGRIDGLTNFELFRHVVVPNVRPALGALAIFTFMASWNSFFWPLIVIDSGERYTLPLAVAALANSTYSDSWPIQMAAATIITLPVIGVFLLFQRWFVRGIALTGVKG